MRDASLAYFGRRVVNRSGRRHCRSDRIRLPVRNRLYEIIVLACGRAARVILNRVATIGLPRGLSPFRCSPAFEHNEAKDSRREASTYICRGGSDCGS